MGGFFPLLSVSNFILNNAIGMLYQHQIIRECTEQIEAKPKNPNHYFSRAQAYKEIGDYNAAIVDLTRVIQMSPNRPQAYLLRGTLHHNLKNYHQASRDFSAA